MTDSNVDSTIKLQEEIQLNIKVIGEQAMKIERLLKQLEQMHNQIREAQDHANKALNSLGSIKNYGLY